MGLWSKQKYIVENCTYHGHDEDFDTSKFLEASKGKKLNAMICNVNSDRTIEAYIKEQNLVIRV